MTENLPSMRPQRFQPFETLPLLWCFSYWPIEQNLHLQNFVEGQAMRLGLVEILLWNIALSKSCSYGPTVLFVMSWLGLKFHPRTNVTPFLWLSRRKNWDINYYISRLILQLHLVWSNKWNHKGLQYWKQHHLFYQLNYQKK